MSALSRHALNHRAKSKMALTSAAMGCHLFLQMKNAMAQEKTASTIR